MNDTIKGTAWPTIISNWYILLVQQEQSITECHQFRFCAMHQQSCTCCQFTKRVFIAVKLPLAYLNKGHFGSDSLTIHYLLGWRSLFYVHRKNWEASTPPNLASMRQNCFHKDEAWKVEMFWSWLLKENYCWWFRNLANQLRLVV